MSELALHRRCPGADAIGPAMSTEAIPVAPGIWSSPGLSNSYLLTTGAGRIVVNAGMSFEALVHRANYDAVDPSPTRYIVVTQGHWDHVGGVDVLRDPATDVVAQANWSSWRHDNELLLPFRAANAAFAWAEPVRAGVAHAKERFGPVLPPQASPEPTIVVDEVLELELGGRRLVMRSTPGGETTDSMIVWLPDEGVCLIGNLLGPLFGHLPNLVTLRGDRYRDALTYIASVETVRTLRPEILLTGHFEPILGAELIDSELRRLQNAVRHLHDETVRGMNAGHDVHALMRDVVVPADLDVGEGYGKASWNVRAIWETYAGWFHHRSTTELYASPASTVHADLVALAGAGAIVARAADHLASGRPLHAIHLVEVVLGSGAHDDVERARVIYVDAHRRLLETSTNFWERAWLSRQIEEAAP